jgi:hypothetical protein
VRHNVSLTGKLGSFCMFILQFLGFMLAAFAFCGSGFLLALNENKNLYSALVQCE